MIPLPIDPCLPAIRAALHQARAVVITARPGAGKTTRVPPVLVDAGPVILLQPRRIAARAVAARIAQERGWMLGEEVGWQVRFDRRASSSTRLLVVTEGILTARLQTDPLLLDFNTIVIDEFHERSIHGDLALALSKQAWRAREDLRLVVMSATLDVRPVSTFLGSCPTIDVPGRTFPIEITHEPDSRAADVCLRLARSGPGSVLCFMPGAAEIRRTIGELEVLRGRDAIDVRPLHGGLDAAEQDAVLVPSASGTARIIVATNIAETSLTVPGVRSVVDAGWQKVARYDAARGIDSLDTERIPQDAADQRAGRAAREGSGRAVRLWDARDRLRPHREPDIHRVDLASVALDILAWGGQPASFEWFEAPVADAIASALRLLDRLGATQRGQLTELGRAMQRIALHPRFARMLIAGGGHPSVTRACALLSERHFVTPRRRATSSDLLSALDDWDSVPPHVKDVSRQIARAAAADVAPGRTPLDEQAFGRMILSAYPDRVGRRRESGSNRFKLASGTGAVLAPDSGVVDGEFIVALDVRAVRPAAVGAHRGATSDSSVIVMASRVDIEWLTPTETVTEHAFDDRTGLVRATRKERYDAIDLRERAAAVDAGVACIILSEAWLRRGPGEADAQLLRRLAFAGLSVDLPALVRAAAYGQRALDRVLIGEALDPQLRRLLERDAPSTLAVPSGRTVRLDYREDGSVTAAVKLQELFGLGDTPRLGPHRQPVVIALLAPNGRPVQVTQDLRSFWNNTYAVVRRELRGRYPRHPWPENPWQAAPTARTRRRAP